MPPAKTDKAEKDLQEVLAKIESIPEPYLGIATKIHNTIISAAPQLKPRLWYGMPGYATGRSAPVRVFFRVDDGVMTFGLTEKAHVEREAGSTLRPCAWYLEEIDAPTQEKIVDLVVKAFE